MRSTQNSHRACCHCARADIDHRTPLNATAAVMRHSCACQVSGGLYCSGLGRCTLLTLRAVGLGEQIHKSRAAPTLVAAARSLGPMCRPGAAMRLGA